MMKFACRIYKYGSGRSDKLVFNAELFISPPLTREGLQYAEANFGHSFEAVG